jgi:hypothetical protein
MHGPISINEAEEFKEEVEVIFAKAANTPLSYHSYISNVLFGLFKSLGLPP